MRERAAYFGMEFVVEPAREPAHLDAVAGIARHQAVGQAAGASLFDVFGDDRGAGNGRLALIDQHRQRAGGIERQKFLAPLPKALVDQTRVRPYSPSASRTKRESGQNG